MTINNEEQLIGYIKNKTSYEIINLFKEIKPWEIYNFNDILLYLIRNNISIEIIKIIIEQQQLGIKQCINGTEVLFYSIECNNFKVAKLLLQNGIKLTNKNHNSNNIVEHLLKVGKLNSRNLSFILDNDINITSEILFPLLSNVYYNKVNILKKFFYFKFYKHINNNIINSLMLYKKGIPMSDNDIQIFFSCFLNPFIINVNEKNKNGSTPLLCLLNDRNNKELIQLLFEYAKENNVIVNINEKNNKGNYPLLKAAKNNKFAVQYFINYAKENNIILELNEINYYGEYPLLNAIENNDIEIVQLLLNYAKEYNIIIEINEKDMFENDPWLKAVKGNNIEIVKLLTTYAKENKIILDMNGKNNSGYYPLLYAVKNDNIDMVRLLMSYAKENDIILEMNETNHCGYPLMCAVKKNNIEIVQLLINYANENKIILKMNGINDNEDYPLKIAIEKNNTEMIQLLMNYSNKYNII